MERGVVMRLGVDKHNKTEGAIESTWLTIHSAICIFIAELNEISFWTFVGLLGPLQAKKING